MKLTFKQHSNNIEIVRSLIAEKKISTEDALVVLLTELQGVVKACDQNSGYSALIGLLTKSDAIKLVTDSPENDWKRQRLNSHLRTIAPHMNFDWFSFDVLTYFVENLGATYLPIISTIIHITEQNNVDGKGRDISSQQWQDLQDLCKKLNAGDWNSSPIGDELIKHLEIRKVDEDGDSAFFDQHCDLNELIGVTGGVSPTPLCDMEERDLLVEAYMYLVEEYNNSIGDVEDYDKTVMMRLVMYVSGVDTKFTDSHTSLHDDIVEAAKSHKRVYGPQKATEVNEREYLLQSLLSLVPNEHDRPSMYAQIVSHMFDGESQLLLEEVENDTVIIQLLQRNAELLRGYYYGQYIDPSVNINQL